MLIERPPQFFRTIFPRALFRRTNVDRDVWLTFDDGPIPEVTPWVLDVLDRFGIKATFFMVGQNIERHPELLEEVRRRGHEVGTHTMHHLQGFHTSVEEYVSDAVQAMELAGSPLFRPPHGMLTRRQYKEMADRGLVVMYDLVTRDYSKRLTPDQVLANVRRYTRPGSIIVFHDSLKSWPRLESALPRALEWLKSQNYEFRNDW